MSERKIRVILIRHGMTQGNLENRYIGGRTDEPLCETGISEIGKRVQKGLYVPAERLFISPMLRCRQTAQLIYPELMGKARAVEQFRECDFGLFEGRNYLEMEHMPEYQAWIDSFGKARFPEGELPAEFNDRCVRAFLRTLPLHLFSADEKKKNESFPGKEETLAYVFHGGTIMAIMSFLQHASEKDYYKNQCRNGEGYVCHLVISDEDSVTCKRHRKISL